MMRRILPLVLIFAAALMASEAFAAVKSRPKTHFLSWESLNRPEEVRRYASEQGSLRRFKISKDRIAKLKKSSFWNKRPYQFASPIVENGRLYVGCDAGRFYAFDVPRGKKVWEFKSEGPVQARAALSDGTVYLADTKAFVYALDAESGAERWRARLDSEVLATPLVSGTRLIVTDLSGRIYALDRGTGGRIWNTDTADKGLGFSVRRASSPIEVGGRIIIGTSSGSVIAYNSGDGTVAWVRQIGDRQSRIHDVDSRPLSAGGSVFVSSADGNFAALNPVDGGVLWTSEAGGVNDPIFHEGRIYASGDGVLTALSPESGTISWQQDLETPEISSPAGGERFVVVATTTDKFYIIDSENGDIIYDRFIRKGSFGDPVIDGEHLYILSNSGALYGFKLKEMPPKKMREPKGKKTGK